MPDATAVVVPDLRGVWILSIPAPPHGSSETESGIIVVTGQSRDARGCMIVRFALFEGDGRTGHDWESRDAYEPDVQWCAHEIAGLLIVEQRSINDIPSLYEHAVVTVQEPGVTLCVIDDMIWDHTPESAHSRNGSNAVVTLPSESIVALIAEHARQLGDSANRNCAVAVRAIPRRTK